MKQLMMTAAASALMLGLAACGDADDVEYGDNDVYGDVETAEVDTVDETDAMMADNDQMDTSAVAVVYLTAADISADELIDTEVIGPTGEEVATVEDLYINASGQVESVIFHADDILNMGGTKGKLPYGEFDIVMDEDNEPRFTVSMTDEAMENVEEWEQEGLNDYNLASEMIGTNAEILNSEESARINDIVINTSGEVQYAVVSDPLMLDTERALPFDRITIEQGDGGSIVIDAAAQDFAMIPRFDRDNRPTSAMDSDPMDTEWDDNDDVDVDEPMDLPQ